MDKLIICQSQFDTCSTPLLYEEGQTPLHLDNIAISIQNQHSNIKTKKSKTERTLKSKTKLWLGIPQIKLSEL